LNEVASYAGVTTYHLCHRFREKTGLTVFRLRDMIRIETAAMALMRNENMQVKRVAYDVGYSSCSYFCLQFRQKTGLTPGEFKKTWPKILKMAG
jgi:two-component system response regulator YesN